MAVYQSSKTGGSTFAGLTWQNKGTVLNKTGLSSLPAFGANLCSGEDDQLTTYVNLKVWDQTLQRFTYPPYVECYYVE